MKNFKYILSLFLVITAFVACEQEDDLPDVSALPAPTNVAAVITIAQDNSGLVTITPTGENVANFRVNYGDGSGTDSGVLNPGESAQNTYAEGSYEVVIAASGINGKTTTIAQTIVVSFQAPENLVVTFENDAAVSKQVNVTATADFAISYEVDFGDPAGTVIMSNIDDVTSFTYDDAGTYTITVTAFSGSVDTISYSEDFEVTEIVAPAAAAPTPNVLEVNVISMFSDAYTDVAVDTWNTGWSDATLEDISIDGNATKKYSNLNFNGIETTSAPIDASGAAMTHFHMDIWSPNATELKIKMVDFLGDGFQGGNGDTEAELTFTPTQGSWVSIDIPLSDFSDAGMTSFSDLNQYIISGMPTSEATVFIDNVYFYKEPNTGSTFDDGLLTNGDFENGSDFWIVGVDDNAPAPVVTVGGDTYYSVDVTTAGNPFDVNMSQKLEIIQDQTYTLTFDAWSDVNRSIIAGIGLSGGDFANTNETVNITPTVTTYTLTLTAAGFGAPDARVLFDVGAETGMVNINNVSLFANTGNLLTNGDFENGSDSWIVGVDDNAPAPVVTVGGNTYYSVDVTTAGNPFDVNMSQKLEIIQDQTYTLTFDAWSDINRSFIAGIGLSGGDFANTNETVNITTAVTNYSLTLTATGFGASDARVLFDVGAETGMVNIDNVVLTVN